MAELVGNWQDLAKPDPEWEQAAEAAGGAPDLGVFPDIKSMRKAFDDIKTSASASAGLVPGVKEQDHQIPMRDGHKITVRVYKPESPSSNGSPLGVVYHGGGWCIGGLVNEEPLCRAMCAKLGMTVVNVDYRLGPEFQHPTAVLDCYDATKWAASNAASAVLGADPSQGFIIGGTSAGGNMVAVVSHLWRDEGMQPPITGCHLMIPSLCNSQHYPEEYRDKLKSWDALPNAPLLSHKAANLFRDNYNPEYLDKRGDPLFSPLLWKSGHKGLGKQCFQIAGMDPLRDEALVYEQILREQDGVKTKVVVYPGQPHGFWSLFPQMKASKKFAEDSIKGIQWLLEQS